MTAVFIVLASFVLLVAACVTAMPLFRGNVSGRTRGIFIAIIAMVPIFAGFIYLEIGAPNALSLTQTPQNSASTPSLDAETIAAMPEEDRNAMIETMVSGLAARLSESGGDIDEWRMLARSYETLGRSEDALGVWRQIIVRAEATINDHKGFAFASVNVRKSEEEPIGEILQESLNKILMADAGDPLALYFLGVAASQAGDRARAVDYWQTLLRDVPPEAPLHAKLQEMIAGTHSANP